MYMIFEILIKVSISLGVIMTCHYLFNNVMNAFSEKKVIDVGSLSKKQYTNIFNEIYGNPENNQKQIQQNKQLIEIIDDDKNTSKTSGITTYDMNSMHEEITTTVDVEQMRNELSNYMSSIDNDDAKSMISVDISNVWTESI